MGWAGLNLLVTCGALILFASFLVFLWNVLASLKGGAAAPDNPWSAGTLEWATSSPPPPYNFSRIPVITSSEPLWAERDALPVAQGLRVDRRELIVSTVREAQPDVRESSPQPSIWPFLASIATGITLIWSIFTPWAVVWGSIPVAVTLIGWFWPKGTKEDES
jgi:hypothetical protein